MTGSRHGWWTGSSSRNETLGAGVGAGVMDQIGRWDEQGRGVHLSISGTIHVIRRNCPFGMR